jgi:hypothetical protein
MGFHRGGVANRLFVAAQMRFGVQFFARIFPKLLFGAFQPWINVGSWVLRFVTGTVKERLGLKAVLDVWVLDTSRFINTGPQMSAWRQNIRISSSSAGVQNPDI